MSKNYRRGVAIGLAGVCLFVTPAAGQTPTVYFIGESRFRLDVTSQVTPEYPAASVTRGSEGVVVSQVIGTPDGRIERVHVLQSPDPDIAAAVRDAVLQWTFRPPHPGQLRDKLTFYFQIRNRKGVVLNPEQVAGNEDVFAAWLQPARRAGGAGAIIVRAENATGIEEIDDDMLRRLLDDASTILLDIRDREPFAASARPRAVNIPFDEVPVRAGAELPRAAQIVIDCSQEDTSKCRFSASTLGERGFKKVAIYIP